MKFNKQKSVNHHALQPRSRRKFAPVDIKAFLNSPPAQTTPCLLTPYYTTAVKRTNRRKTYLINCRTLSGDKEFLVISKIIFHGTTGLLYDAWVAYIANTHHDFLVFFRPLGLTLIEGNEHWGVTFVTKINISLITSGLFIYLFIYLILFERTITFRKCLVTPKKRLHYPHGGNYPQFENHCFRR